MLFTDQSDGHDAACRQRDRHPEEALEHENAFGVMPERTVAEVRYDRLRFVAPLMEREIVVRRPAPAARRGKSMVITMSPPRLLKARGCYLWWRRSARDRRGGLSAGRRSDHRRVGKECVSTCKSC